MGAPGGQACNTVEDVGSPITPTCTTGAMPAGVGGTIVDGTYVLTAQTYVNVGACPETPVSGTLVFAGNCVQTISRFPIMATSAGRFTVQENVFNYSPVCFSAAGFDSGAFTPDEPGGTFTATATGFTRFTANAAAGNPNPDRVEVYARR